MIDAVALLEQIVIVYSIGPTRNLQHRAPGKMIKMAMVNSRVCHETTCAAHPNSTVTACGGEVWTVLKCDAREPK